MSLFENLQPEVIWKYFEEILAIPRPSTQEGKIRDYLINFGTSHGLKTKTDKIGNVLISKPASPGKENYPGVILQSHMDMVCEKNSDVAIDFMKDPINAYRDGNWVRARGTTLGADDGIGIAAQLAILDSIDLVHGPLECLFTVDEETGLKGAFGLEQGFMEGKILLNLDSEDEGEVFIGCAGGVDVTAGFDLKYEATEPGNIGIRLAITGLRGGHSGDDIHKGYGNAVKLMTRFLWSTASKTDIRIHELSGGNLRNALARESFCTLATENQNLEAVKSQYSDFLNIVKKELGSIEPAIRFEITETKVPEMVLNKDLQERLINSLYACPHGVFAWSKSIKGLVETSSNLAAVKFQDSQIIVTTSQRSSLASSKNDMANMVCSVFNLAKALISRTGVYPGWTPDPSSNLVKLSEKTYSDLFGKPPIVRAIHAGLECGLFLEKYPDLEMVSFGPTIRGAHSPDERLDIESTQKFWKFLIEILQRLAANG